MGTPCDSARFVLFRPIKKRSFNLLCVLDFFFSERWQSTLFPKFAYTINETLKCLTQRPALMESHSGGDSVASRW